MPTPSTPIDEVSRLKELHALELDGVVSQLEFDNLTQLAGEICDAPVALITLVDQNIVWFKSSLGFDAPQAPREHSFCSAAIEGVAPMIVEDASADPRFQKNEVVRAPQGIRFYAGVPLVLGSGFVVGTLCVMDYKVRTLSEKELNSLAKLAGQVIALIEARRTQLRLLMQESSRLVSEERLEFALKAAEIGDWDRDLRTNVARRSLLHDRCFGYTEAVPVWGYDTFLAHIIEADRTRVDGCYQRALAGQCAYDVEYRVVWPDQTVHWLWSKGRFYFDDAGKPNRLILRLGSIEVGMDQAISAGLLVNELISNCLKHAFPQQRAGEVSVVFQPVDAATSDADPLWRLGVSDTGVGLPPDFDQRRKTSLGLELADDLGQQIGGSLMIESRPGQGAQFTIIFTTLAPKSLVMPL